MTTEKVDAARLSGASIAPAESAKLAELELAQGESYRRQVHTAEDIVDVQTYGGGFDLTRRATAPRLRVGDNKWFNLLWLIPIGFALLIAAVAIGKGLYNMPAVQAFIHRYPGVDAHAKTPGVPAWLGWTHFFNLFMMIFIIRSGIQILCDHPRLYFSRNATPGKDEWLRVGPPVPDDELWTANADTVALPPQFGLPGFRHSIGLARWWHLGIDVLWLLNGAIFYVLLFTTGQWRHIVPTSWTVFPNAASVAIQYLSVEHWPTDNGWVAYNALQVLAYFTTVFIAAPAALITGLGMSPALSMRFTVISKRLSIQHARSLHFLVLVYFLFFIIVHVTLVFSTTALKNLNHMFAARDDNSWTGFTIFAAAMVVCVVAWVAATPFTIRHPRVIQRVGDALIGPFQRLLERLDPKPGAFTEKDISPFHWRNGRLPETDEYEELEKNDFVDWRLRVSGLVENPTDFSLDELKALPYHEQISQHFCIQGWSGVAKWGGVQVKTIMDIVKPLPEAKWVVFYSMGLGGTGGLYYSAHTIEQMRHHLSTLAYNMNDQPLPYLHGRPLRLRNELQHGFRMVKWIKGIEFVAHYSEIGSGYGGYSEDSKFFGRHQTI